MIGKKHEINSKTVFAACDKELLNKTLEEGNVSIKVKESFYGKEEIKEEKAKKLMKECDSINLIGKKAVSVALKEGIASERNMKRIKGIPHIQVYRL
ncbi:MAG: DUF424 family protein [Candidatus Diapherotrites archaeon]|nr:DUF424 family protein [Candidatus Diapherotrites archaeon]